MCIIHSLTTKSINKVRSSHKTGLVFPHLVHSMTSPATLVRQRRKRSIGIIKVWSCSFEVHVLLYFEHKGFCGWPHNTVVLRFE